MGINAIFPGQVLANDASVGDVLTAQADGSSAFQSPAGGGIGDITAHGDRRGGGVVERINQTAEGIEE